MLKPPSTRGHLLMVTFDLPNPVPGDHRYRDIDRYLASLGTVIRPLKQTRLLITAVSAAMVLRGVHARIGLHGSVGAIQVSRLTRIHIADPAMRLVVRRAIRRYGSP